MTCTAEVTGPWIKMSTGLKLLSLLCFADRGTVQKVIVLPRDDLQTEELVLEEVEVFKVGLLILLCLLLLYVSSQQC